MDEKPAWFYKHHRPAILNNISDKILLLEKHFLGLHYKQSVSLPWSVDDTYVRFTSALEKTYPLVNLVFSIEVTWRTPSYTISPHVWSWLHSVISRESS